MRFERGASNTFTIPARPTTSPSNWLLRFVKVDGGLEVLCIADAYAVTGMPVQLTFTEVDSAPSATDGEVTLSLGQWHLYVYEQASASNLNFTLATRQPFDTLVEVVGAAVPDPPPTNPCSGEGDPVTIRTTDGLTEIDTSLPGTNYDLPQSHIKYTEADGMSINTLDAFDTEYQSGDDMLYPDVVIPASRVFNTLGNPASSGRVTLKDLVDGFGPFQQALDSTVQLNGTTIGNVPANATGDFDVVNSSDAPVGSLGVDKWRVADATIEDQNGNPIDSVLAEGTYTVIVVSGIDGGASNTTYTNSIIQP